MGEYIILCSVLTVADQKRFPQHTVYITKKKDHHGFNVLRFTSVDVVSAYFLVAVFTRLFCSRSGVKNFFLSETF